MTRKTPLVGITIRLACDKDAHELAALATQLGYPSKAAQFRKRLTQITADEEQVVFAAVLPDGELAGFTHVFTTSRLFCDPFVELGALVVDEEMRGIGIGTMLVRAAERWVAACGLSQIRIRSNALRAGAKGFYLRLDYELSKTQNVFFKQME